MIWDLFVNFCFGGSNTEALALLESSRALRWTLACSCYALCVTAIIIFCYTLVVIFRGWK